MKKQLAYLVGIKGVAMTSLAVYLTEKGYKVIGSDVKDSFSTDSVLKKYKIEVLPGFSKENIPQNADLVVVSGAHGGADNVEAKYAKKLGISVFMHGSYLGKISDEKKTIAVAGCHGKTTTSSMVATILSKADLDPSFAIGTAYINDFGPSGHFGKGKHFIVEADEYVNCPNTDVTPRFLYLHPQIAVITNIEYDHPDVYKNLDDVKNAYISFIKNIKSNGILITSIDDPGVSSILNKLKSTRVITYGFSPRADFRIEKFYQNGLASFMKVVNKHITVGEFMINIPGKHNLSNALAASIMGKEIGLSWDKIKNLLSLYKGCNRRFELIYDSDNIKLYDDYAHHPSEIRATIKSFKERFPESKLVVIFQPHTFSRTKQLESKFASAFTNSDKVLLVDIFPSAREKFDPNVSSAKLASSINKIKNNALYVSSKIEGLNIIKKNLLSNTVVVTMGAGDLNSWHKDLIELIKNL